MSFELRRLNNFFNENDISAVLSLPTLNKKRLMDLKDKIKFFYNDFNTEIEKYNKSTKDKTKGKHLLHATNIYDELINACLEFKDRYNKIPSSH